MVDGNRMAVSMTYTLENLYGSRVVVPGAGFLLNDEMNDFAWLPGTTDSTGRIGTVPNQITPGKRMLSSMCPTIVLRGGKPVLVTGSPGGRTIINTVLQVVVNVVDFQMDLRTAVDARGCITNGCPIWSKSSARWLRLSPQWSPPCVAWVTACSKNATSRETHTRSRSIG